MKSSGLYISFLGAQGSFWNWLGGLFGPVFIGAGVAGGGIGSARLWVGLLGLAINLLALHAGMHAKRQQRASNFVACGVVSALALLIGLSFCLLYYVPIGPAT